MKYSWWRHPIRTYKKFLEDMKDQKLNRELIGRDKYGNKYYQYYSPWGLPTRREVEHVAKERTKQLKDLVFFRWMVRQETLPPTEQEIQEQYAFLGLFCYVPQNHLLYATPYIKNHSNTNTILISNALPKYDLPNLIISYRLQEERRRNIIAYEEKEAKLLEEFYSKRKELDSSNQDWKKLAEVKEDFQPEMWNPKEKFEKKKKNKESNDDGLVQKKGNFNQYGY